MWLHRSRVRQRGVGRAEEFWDPASSVPEKTTFGETGLWRRHIHERGLMQLASNPFLLTQIYLVWVTNAQTMPRNREYEADKGFQLAADGKQ